MTGQLSFQDEEGVVAPHTLLAKDELHNPPTDSKHR